MYLYIFRYSCSFRIMWSWYFGCHKPVIPVSLETDALYCCMVFGIICLDFACRDAIYGVRSLSLNAIHGVWSVFSGTIHGVRSVFSDTMYRVPTILSETVLTINIRWTWFGITTYLSTYISFICSEIEIILRLAIVPWLDNEIVSSDISYNQIMISAFQNIGDTMHDNLPKRKNIRLRGYNYSQHGAYFITICVRNRKHLFGRFIIVCTLITGTGEANNILAFR